MRILLFICYTFLSCFLMEAQAQVSKSALEKQIDNLMTQRVKSSSPGSSVLVVKDGAILFNKGYGLANLEHEIPIGPNTIFDLASVSKQFAAFAISSLVEKGKIKLEDDIRKYIPELPDFGKTISIDHLVHHTSGIRDWPATLTLAGWSFDDVISFDQILQMAYKQQALNFEPGSEYSYTNTGYNLLALLVEKVTGQSFADWTQENIFQPLGMDNTQFLDDHTRVISNRAQGYFRRSNTFHAQPNNLMALGSSSMYSSTSDLAKWVIALDQPTADLKPIIERMFQKGILNNGEENAYAFGLSVRDYRNATIISHSGSWASFRTYLAYFPEQHLSIVVLNNYPSNPSQTVFEIASWFIPEPAESDSNPEEITEEKTMQLTNEILDEYVGTYRLGPAWYVTLTRKGNQLWTQATGEDIFPMTSINESLFRIDAYGGRTMAFHRDDQGKVKHFVYAGMECPKVEDLRPLNTEDLKAYLGSYYSEELETTYEVLLIDEELKFRHFRHGDLGLNHAWGDDFSGNRFFINSVEFQRNLNGKVIGLSVSQARSRKQWFTKVK